MTEANIVTGKNMRDHNTFEAPETVVEQAFSDYKETSETIAVTLPVNSVVELRVSKVK